MCSALESSARLLAKVFYKQLTSTIHALAVVVQIDVAHAFLCIRGPALLALKIDLSDTYHCSTKSVVYLS